MRNTKSKKQKKSKTHNYRFQTLTTTTFKGTQNAFFYYRMCSFTIECVLLLTTTAFKHAGTHHNKQVWETQKVKKIKNKKTNNYYFRTRWDTANKYVEHKGYNTRTHKREAPDSNPLHAHTREKQFIKIY